MPIYYTLIVEIDDNRWSIEFGDYDLDVVEDERDDYQYRGQRTRIITSQPDQGSINAAFEACTKTMRKPNHVNFI